MPQAFQILLKRGSVTLQRLDLPVNVGVFSLRLDFFESLLVLGLREGFLVLHIASLVLRNEVIQVINPDLMSIDPDGRHTPHQGPGDRVLIGFIDDMEVGANLLREDFVGVVGSGIRLL